MSDLVYVHLKSIILGPFYGSTLLIHFRPVVLIIKSRTAHYMEDIDLSLCEAGADYRSNDRLELEVEAPQRIETGSIRLAWRETRQLQITIHHSVWSVQLLYFSTGNPRTRSAHEGDSPSRGGLPPS